MCQHVLHVDGGLEDREGKPGFEQPLLRAQLLPVVRHRLGLRVEHGVVDEVLDARGERRFDGHLGDGHLVRGHVGWDVIDCPARHARLRP